MRSLYNSFGFQLITRPGFVQTAAFICLHALLHLLIYDDGDSCNKSSAVKRTKNEVSFWCCCLEKHHLVLYNIHLKDRCVVHSDMLFCSPRMYRVLIFSSDLLLTGEPLQPAELLLTRCIFAFLSNHVV